MRSTASKRPIFDGRSFSLSFNHIGPSLPIFSKILGQLTLLPKTAIFTPYEVPERIRSQGVPLLGWPPLHIGALNSQVNYHYQVLIAEFNFQVLIASDVAAGLGPNIDTL